MRLEKVKKEKIMVPFSSGVPKGYVGNGYPANPLFKIKGWAVTGKIEKMTWPGKSCHLLSLESSLQFVKDKRSHLIHIDPGPQDGKHIRVFQFRYRFLYLISA